MEVLTAIILLFLLNYNLIEVTHAMAILLGFFFMHHIKDFDTLSGSLSLCLICVLAVGFLLNTPSSYLFVLVGFFLHALRSYLT